jgi:predicted HicB family RNase H-like nuclease
MKQEKTPVKTFPLRLSRTMRIQVQHLADQEGISINQFIALAIAEKLTRFERAMPHIDGRHPKDNK